MSDGRFSEKPLRSEHSRAFARSDGEFSAEPRLSADAAQLFLQSPAVRREVDALMDQAFPEIGQRDCDPLPKKTPAKALDLGRPLTSARLVQEFLISLLFLRMCGWIFMFFGALILLGALIFFMQAAKMHPQPRAESPAFVGMIMAAFGLVIGAVGAWFGIFRGRVINEMCWFCPRGMIWMTEGHFDWYTWEQVRDVYCTPHADRPAIGISLGRNVSWISFSNTQASRLLVEHIEKQASAACMPAVLNVFAEGKSIRFGLWRLSRFSIFDADTECPWRDVIDLDCTPREVFIKQRDNAKLFVSLDEIPFPSLFTALALAAFAHARAQTS